MKDFLIGDIGRDFKIAFPLEEVYKVYHAFDEVFPQLKMESLNLIEFFKGSYKDESYLVIVLLKDGLSVLLNDVDLLKNSEELKIYPINKIFFEKGMDWTNSLIREKEMVYYIPDFRKLAKIKNETK